MKNDVICSSYRMRRISGVVSAFKIEIQRRSHETPHTITNEPTSRIKIFFQTLIISQKGMKFFSSVGMEGQLQALNTPQPAKSSLRYHVLFNIILILSFICEYIHQEASSFPTFGFHFLVPNKNPKYLVLIYSVMVSILDRDGSCDAHHYIFSFILLLLLPYIHITQNKNNCNNASN